MKKGEWRCKVCKFKNSEEDEEGNPVVKCTMCKEPKQVMKEASSVNTTIPKAPTSKH